MTEYAPKINWKAARPDVSLSEILPLDDDDYRENRFMQFDAMENADGRRYRIADLPFDRKLSLQIALVQPSLFATMIPQRMVSE